MHKFANYRKNIKSIWKIADDDGNLVEGFDSIARAGVHHFENLFQEDKTHHLPDIMKIAENFPTSIVEEENEDLMIHVTLVEIQYVLSLSNNDKSPGSDGILVEVYRALFDVLGLDLLRVVDDSWKCGKIPIVFTSTLIALIPKIDHPKSFEDFRPISLCNFIYEIIGKIISMCIRKVLGRYISSEQFGFMPGRHIHDVVGVI